MRPGTTIAGRFEIEERAGAGGMGIVYRALDRRTGEPVALKVLHHGQPAERFLREAGTLALISHPAIVRYVDHGTLDSGRPYLAMEWIDGSTLAALLKQRRLGVGETQTLIRRVAQGLSEAHRRGVLHRDVKPSNIYLPDGRLGDAKLIDFGVARRRFDPQITETGLVVGTLAYMSPEQASADPDLDASCDVFSLGCVLYKCLTGDSPFQGGDATAVLAKVLLDDPTPIRELSPEVPPELERLALRMLSKQRSARPANADEVASALDELGDVSRLPSAPPPDPALTSREQRVVWVVLVGGAARDSATAEISPEALLRNAGARIDACVGKYGGRYDRLADGTALATFSGGGAPTDQAQSAVCCARELGEIARGHPIAVAMGRSVVGSRQPFGRAIDRGSELLARSRPGRLRVDAETARLIGARFSVEADAAGLFVSGERSGPEIGRKLLGRPTPCVGRDRELEMLDALFDECVSEPVARALLVTGPAGSGKSRLRYEFVKRLERRGSFEILIGRADSSSRGAPFAVLRDAIRRSASIVEGEPLELARDKLITRLARSMGAEAARTAAPFIGEIVRVPFDDSESAALRRARSDPTAMSDATRVAWLDWLASEADRNPLLVVLEDLHWGDAPSLRYAGAALSTLAERPLMILALGRPELREVLPSNWKELEVSELGLRPLLKAESARLVREVLGDDASETTVERLVELAGGNAFHLEELIRMVAEGRRDLPDSIVGMAQARLEALGSEQRRLLRAASVFGERFWLGGVTALTGGEPARAGVTEGLSELALGELVSERPSSALAGETEFVFRNSLMREVAYATLTDDDRALGHLLAASWLSQAGETEPLVLAEHYARGRRPDAAAEWYARAALQAIEGNDLSAAIERVDQALACDPAPHIRGELGYAEGHARLWQGAYGDAEQPLRTAIERLPRGSVRWFQAVSDLTHLGNSLEQRATEDEARQLALEAVPEDDPARIAQMGCIARAATGMLKAGDLDGADALVARMAEISSSLEQASDAAVAWLHHARSARAYYVGDVVEFRREVEAASRAFDAVGDVRNATTDRINLGYVHLSVGDHARAEQELSAAFASCERLGLSGTAAYALHNLGLAVGRLGRLEQGVRLQRRALELAERTGEKQLIGGIQSYLALLLIESGELPAAIEAARSAIDELSSSPPLSAYAHSVLAGALCAAGDAEAAYQAARRANELLGEQDAPGEVRAHIDLALAKSAHASGDLDTARAVIGAARQRLLDRAARIDDPALRESFLRVPDHAQTLALAAEWLDG